MRERSLLLHTMATPMYTPLEALDLARSLDLAGLELICQEGYVCGLAPHATYTEARAVRQAARERGLCLGSLVAYPKGTNARPEGERAAAVAELKCIIELAEILDCPQVRVFAGEEVPAAAWLEALPALVASLQELADFAHPRGITLNIENHMETMALSAEQTLRIVTDVARPNVGIVYDQANLTFLGAEACASALAVQEVALNHVHVKDIIIASGQRKPALPGAGIIAWPDIIAALDKLEYRGFYALEYEKRWFPADLPAPEIGLRLWRDYLVSLGEGA
jgi:sugar phosphate isomerase/epimerase